ncbi:MAG: hypothetical protein IJ206_04190 [Oscillospiraceae bacterium]|nr:hypothetical protein [Oscillospiraceae bacterium]
MNKWITANAFAQRELAPAISPDVRNCTIRTSVRAGLSGTGIQLVFEEGYGQTAADYRSVVLELDGTAYNVLFHGMPSFSVAPGQQAVSDGLSVPVHEGEELTLYIAMGGSPSMSETTLEQRHSAPGDYTHGGFEPVPYQPPLQGVPFNERLCGLKEIRVEGEGVSIAAFGDSVTESAVWTIPLGQKIAALRPNMTLLNLGIGGNRLLRDTNVPAMAGLNAFGRSGLRRLDSDIFALQGVKAVIVALGANDIAQPGGPPGFSPPASELCTFAELRDGLQEIAGRCRAKGLGVIGATITPFQEYPSYNEASARVRNEINAWIREAGAFDYVLDFAALLCDPADSERLAPGFGLGDGLHPNPVGGAAAAERIDVAEMLRAVGL